MTRSDVPDGVSDDTTADAPAGTEETDDWHRLVTAALLGTDRRDPPELAPGAVLDVVDDVLAADGAERLLAAVAATAAVRRAAFVALPVADPIAPPADDARDWCPSEAVDAWRTVISEWPVLEDEWVLTVIEQGWRLPPDVVVVELLRTRDDAVRRARVAIAGGPTVEWLVDHVPSLGPVFRRSAPADQVRSLPELPVPPELSDLLTADARTVGRRIGAGLADGSFDRPHRNVLVNLVARCRPAVLLDLADAAEGSATGLGAALADVARLRHRSLTTLGAAP